MYPLSALSTSLTDPGEIPGKFTASFDFDFDFFWRLGGALKFEYLPNQEAFPKNCISHLHSSGIKDLCFKFQKPHEVFCFDIFI